MLRKALLISVIALFGCSDDDSTGSVADTGREDPGPVDSAIAKDSAPADSTTPADSASADSSVNDSAVADSSAADTAMAEDSAFDAALTWDTAGACHTFGFGAKPATIAMVGSLPTMTGGTIPTGVFDAVAAQTTGTTGVGGTYQATWSFVAGNKIESIEALTLSGTPPTPVPRVLTWSTTGTNLTRTQVCGGSSSFTNEYTVRTEGGATYLDVRQASLMFTFKKR